MGNAALPYQKSRIAGNSGDPRTCVRAALFMSVLLGTTVMRSHRVAMGGSRCIQLHGR
jgi:hypothetical protein